MLDHSNDLQRANSEPSSVAIDIDTIVVGADWKNGTFTRQGAAYIFARDRGGADSWGQVKKLTASDAAIGDYFGNAVAISGDTAAVGAFRESSSTGAAYLYVAWGANRTSLAASPNPSLPGQTVSFTATVTSTVGIPSGTVSFTIDSAVVATATLSSGTATFSTSSLSVGSHSVSASYGGDIDYIASTSPVLTQVVGKADTNTTISAVSPNPGFTNQPISVTFTVSAVSGPGIPTGSVTVDGGAGSCDAVLPATSCALQFTLPDTYTITVNYAGDAGFNGSSSTPISETINYYKVYVPIVMRDGQ